MFFNFLVQIIISNYIFSNITHGEPCRVVIKILRRKIRNVSNWVLLHNIFTTSSFATQFAQDRTNPIQVNCSHSITMHKTGRRKELSSQPAKHKGNILQTLCRVQHKFIIIKTTRTTAYITDWTTTIYKSWRHDWTFDKRWLWSLSPTHSTRSSRPTVVGGAGRRRGATTTTCPHRNHRQLVHLHLHRRVGCWSYGPTHRLHWKMWTDLFMVLVSTQVSASPSSAR